MLFRRKKDDEYEEEYGRELISEEASKEVPIEEYIASLGRSAYLFMDPDVKNAILEDPKLKNLYPAFSHLNRLTQKDRKALKLDHLYFKRLRLLHEADMQEDQYDFGGWEKCDALQIFFNHQNWDNLHGFKARVVTEIIKRIHAEVETKKRRRLLPF